MNCSALVAVVLFVLDVAEQGRVMTMVMMLFCGMDEKGKRKDFVDDNCLDERIVVMIPAVVVVAVVVMIL